MSLEIDNKEAQELLQCALDYLSKGISIIPVGKDKKPLIAWKEYTERIATEQEVIDWFTKFRGCQIGIVTGKISGLTVVDIEKGGDTTGMPITRIAKTGGGGWHYYFKYTPEIGNKARIRPLTDIRNDSGFVVAPPSSNLSGKYEWIVEEQITDFPYHLFNIQKRQDWQQITEGTTEGSRNESAAKIIGKLLKTFRQEEWNTAAWSMVVAWNQNNRPPLGEKELRTTFESICRKARIKGDGLIEEVEKEVKVEYVSFTNLIQLATDELLNINPKEVISFGYDWLDERLTGIFPGELVVVGGESGCLHPNTVIYDPIDKSNFTVKERYKQKKDFYVYSLDEKKNIIITQAKAPQKFFKTKMYELSNGKEKIVVTPKHRFWDGSSFVEMQQLSKFSSCLLPTIEDISLLKLQQDAQHYSEKDVNFPNDCHPLYHLYGQQPLLVSNSVQDVFPSQDDVHEHIYGYNNKGGLDSRLEYNHFCQSFFLLSKLDCVLPENNMLQNEQKYYLVKDTFLQSFLKLPLIDKLHFCLFLAYNNLYIVLSVLLSKVYNIFLNFLPSLSCFSPKKYNLFNYTKWDVKQVEDEIYYDFHVPIYENYYACGLFNHNSGKTNLCTNIVYKTANLGHKCLIFGLEDRLNDYGIKALFFEINKHKKMCEGQNIAGYDWNLYRTNKLINDEQFIKYLALAYDTLKKDNVYFAKVDEIMTIELLEKIVEEKTAEGFELFLIDHLHYFDLQKGKNSKADYIEEIMVKIRTMQRRTGARIIMVVHYRKLNGARPNLDSFKDSISIVQNANYVINLWRDRSFEADETSRYRTYFYIPKARNPQGECVLELNFNPVTSDYEPITKQEYARY